MPQPKRFDLDGTLYEFPDDTSDDEALAALSALGPKGQREAPSATPRDPLAVIGRTPLLPNLPRPADPILREDESGEARRAAQSVERGDYGLEASMYALEGRRLGERGAEVATGLHRVRTEPGLSRKLGGASDAFRAAGAAALPYVAPMMAPAVAAAPVAAPAAMALSYGLQAGVEKGAGALGAGEGTARFLGDVAGMVPLPGLGKMALRGARGERTEFLPPPEPRPVPRAEPPAKPPTIDVRPEPRPDDVIGYLRGKKVTRAEREAMGAARPAAPDAPPPVDPVPPPIKPVPTARALLEEPEVKLPDSPEEAPKFEVRDTPPKGPIGLDAMRAKYPGWKFDPEPEPVGDRPQVIWATTPGGGRIKIQAGKGEIKTDPAAVAAQVGRPLRGAERATGAFVPVEDLILLGDSSDPGTFKYETFRWAWKNLLKWKERSALLKEYGSETNAAAAFRDQARPPAAAGPLGVLRQRLSDLKQDWSFSPDARATLGRLEDDRIWKRATNQPGVERPDGNFLRNLWNSWEETRASKLAGTNLSGLTGLDEEAQRAVVRGMPGVGRVSARTQYIQTAPKVDAEMQGVRVRGADGTERAGDWDVFKVVGVASRLEGAKARWAQLSEAVKSMSDNEFSGAVAKGDPSAFEADGYLRRIIGELAEFDGSTARIDRLDDFLDGGKVKEARDYVGRNFAQTATEVEVPDLMGKYGRTLKEFADDPAFQRALAVYKEGLEVPIRTAHLGNEGFLSTALGPLDTYIPLTAVRDDPSLIGGAVVRRSRWERPVNPTNYFTYGLAKEYDTSNEAMMDAFSHAFESNYKKVAMEYLVKRGLAVRSMRPAGGTARIKGEEVPVRTFQMPGSGKGPTQYMAVPEDLAAQLEPLLEARPITDRRAKAHDLMNLMTAYSLLGLSDNRFNMSMMLNAADSGLPWFKRGWQNVWGIKTLVGMKDVYHVATKELGTPQGQATLRQMAQEGALSPRSTAITADQALARTTGLEYTPHPGQRDFWTKFRPEVDEHTRQEFRLRRLTAGYLPEGSTDPVSIALKGIRTKAEGAYGALSYGPRGIDTAVRYRLWTWHKAQFPEAGPIDRTAFVNQAGNYIWGMQTRLERQVKASLLGPIASTFVTARLTNLRNGLRFATAGLPPGTPSKLTSAESAALRLGSAVTNGVLGMAMLNILGSKAVSDKYPWEDPHYRVGYLHVPQGSPYRNHPIVQRFAGGDPELDAYIPLTALNPQLYRGLQGLGVSRGFEEIMRGQRPADAAVEGLVQAGNTLAAPFVSGPVLQAGAAAFGRRVEQRRPFGDWVGDPTIGASHLGQLGGYLQPSKSYPEAIFKGMVRGAGSLNQMVEPGIAEAWDWQFGSPMKPESKHDYGDPTLQVMWQMIMPRTAPVGYNARRQRQLAQKIRKGRERLERP